MLRHWKHWWTPLSSQQGSTMWQPRQCATNQQRQPAKIISDGFTADGSHCDFVPPGRDGFRGRDCRS